MFFNGKTKILHNICRRRRRIFQSKNNFFNNIYKKKEFDKRNQIIKAKKFDLEDYSSDEEDENLGPNSNFILEKRELTLKEQEEEEEKKLYEFIETLNSKHQNNKLKNDSFEESDYNSSDDEYNLLQKKKSKNEISSIETFASSNISYNEIELNDDIIKHNIINYEKVIKIMLIGNKNSGKSLFCKKILNNKEEIKETQFLEIKKKVVEINNEKILLELWDSNEQFINSALINIYYKLANAFIIIVDTNSDFNFIKKQINLIKSIQKNAQILFICNNKYNNNDLFNIEKYKEFIYKDKNFFNLMNLHEISIDNNVIQNFLLKLI